MSGQRVGYLRVSSVDQNEARQLEAVGPCDKTFVEKMSARSRQDRPQLAAMLGYVRGGDEVVVASMDRLARSVVDLRNLVDEIRAEGAAVTFVKEQITYRPDAADPRADLMLALLGGIAEFERAIIRERQAEGIALAKKKGKYTGRASKLDAARLAEARRKLAAGETRTAVARELGVDRSTLFRNLRRTDNQEQS